LPADKNPRTRSVFSALPTKIREQEARFLACRQKSANKKHVFHPADKNPRTKNTFSRLSIFVGDQENAFFLIFPLFGGEVVFGRGGGGEVVQR
jgi:hypothetical protein